VGGKTRPREGTQAVDETGGGPRRNGRHLEGAWPIIRFVALTLFSLVGFFLLTGLPWVQDRIIQPYTYFVAESSRVVLRVLGVDAGSSGTLLISPEFSVNILNVCNGVEVTAILFAVILSFPASWKQKLIGLAIGYPVIYCVNLARIVVLFFLGFKHPEIFETVHYYYAQGFVILATLAIWLLWVSLCSGYGGKNDKAAAN
jgi:exosortase H (IPTLxxWG-CTERM-specific)